MKAKPRGRTARKVDFYWFQGASVRELYDRIGAANPDTARVEARVNAGKVLLRVVAEGHPTSAADSTTDINDSRACPPICPK